MQFTGISTKFKRYLILKNGDDVDLIEVNKKETVSTKKSRESDSSENKRKQTGLVHGQRISKV